MGHRQGAARMGTVNYSENGRTRAVGPKRLLTPRCGGFSTPGVNALANLTSPYTFYVYMYLAYESLELGCMGREYGPLAWESL